MELEDQFHYLVGGYFGIRNMDEYDLKVYILKDIENYIREFLMLNPIDSFSYQEEAKKIEEEITLKESLQDALLVLPKVDAPMELTLLVKKRLKEIREKELLEYK